MQTLKRRILQDGQVISNDILKVNSFLNHQIDPLLMQQIGQEFKKIFADLAITKILTIESSDIAPALMTGLEFQVPVVFARKTKSTTMSSNNYAADVFSYTKQTTNHILVDKNFLSSTDHVLIIDDFLANGEAVHGLIQICQQAQCQVSGIGIVIEKAFQQGGERLLKEGFNLHSLVKIKSLQNHTVQFVED